MGAILVYLLTQICRMLCCFLVNPDMDNVSPLANPDMKAGTMLEGYLYLFTAHMLVSIVNLDKWAGIVGKVTWGYGLFNIMVD